MKQSESSIDLDMEDLTKEASLPQILNSTPLIAQPKFLLDYDNSLQETPLIKPRVNVRRCKKIRTV